jgi:hypothetical protein
MLSGMTTQRPWTSATPVLIGLILAACQSSSETSTSGTDDSAKAPYPTSGPSGAAGAPSVSLGSDSDAAVPAGPSSGWSGAAGAAGSAGIGGSTGTAAPTVPGTDPVAIATATSTATATTPPQQAGQLTAGTWDDNLNFDFYTSYLEKTLTSQASGLPILDRSVRMIILVVTADGSPVPGASVRVADAAGHVFASTTGGEGRVLYFPGSNGVAQGAQVTITASLGNDVAEQAATATTGTVGLTLGATTHQAVTALDLAFVIDTTGSMGDELSYIQRELDGIVGGVASAFPGLAQRYALIVYRDDTDAYVVRTFDFTADLAAFRANLLAQSADGGGDMPEAVDQALAAAGQLGWSPGAVARVAFWIADAPHHAGRQTAVVTALQAAVAKGVHIYPVAASGIDDLAEFTMRTAAEVTGGRYLFLTNDSGIGNSHAEPHIPCYYVTTLASAIRRMVATEVSGAYVAPEPTEIIRTSGNPVAQQCALSDGGLVTVW